MNYQPKDQRGVAQLVLVVVALVVLAGVGFAGWTVMNKNKDSGSTATSTVSTKETADACKKAIDDDDLCKFISSWNGEQKFAATMTNTADGKTSTSTIKIDGDKTYMKMDGEAAMEVISIGKDTYTKAGDTWWKMASTSSTTSSTDTTAKVNPDDYKLDVPTSSSESTGPEYKKLGKEACGKLTCFKYQFFDSGDSTTKNYIWFDDSDYLMRKMLTESADGSAMEMQYAYDNISVSVPSPVKELAANQYIIPGQTEPMTMPDMGQ